MDPKSSSRPARSGKSWPKVDDPLVRPETREEMVRGELIHAAPALEPHAERHHALDFITAGCIAPGYVGASDLLTRASEASSFATDTCIRREGIDPITGSRYLEELAFEIVSEQPMRDITARAEDLCARGVRRLIAIFVKTNEVREWSRERGDWVMLDPDDTIEDPTLAAPIPVRALLDQAEATGVVIRGLHARREPELMAIEARARASGYRTAIEAVCEVLGIPLGPERRAHLEGLEPAGLEALLDQLRLERRWP